MKLPALLIVISLAANAALLSAFAFRPERLPSGLRDYFTSDATRAAQQAADTRAREVAARAAAKSAAPREKLWPTLATEDYRTLIARLRAAGFPPAIIRQIVTRQVSAVYNARTRAIDDASANTPFWKLPSSYYDASDKRYEELTRINREHSKVLRELFSTDEFADPNVSAVQRRRFGDLSPAKIDQLQRIEDDYAEMNSTLRTATKGISLPEDLEKFALLAREKRADLAAILTPQELADYEMRTSAATRMIAGRLGGFEATEAEFRALYQAHEALNKRFPEGVQMQQISMSLNGGQRETLENEYNAQLQASLGAARYAEFVRETNTQYQQLMRLAEQQKIPATTARQAFDVRDTVSRESNRIADDTSLTSDQKLSSLQALAQSTRNQLIALLGPSAGPSYVKVADQWLTHVERGSAVTFGGAPLTIARENGSMSFAPPATYRPVVTPSPNR